MTFETKSVAKMAAEVKASFATKHDAVKDIAEKALAESAKGIAMTETAKELADAAITGMNEAKGRLDELEQKMVRKGNDEADVKSYGEQFIQSDAFKSFEDNSFQGSAKLSLKMTSAQAGVFSARDGEITPLGRRTDILVRDLLNVVATNSGSIDYARQSVRTNAAAPVAESAAKPYSDYQWETVNTPVRVIAHLAKITRQAMDDATQLQGEVDSEMRFGLRLAEEAQIISGSGVGNNINGLVAQSTAYAAPFTPSGTLQPVDFVRLAMLQVALANYPADGVIMHPSDWARIELLKDADGRYLHGLPGTNVSPSLWGLPVAVSQGISIDKVLVGAFKMQTLYDRMAPEVLISSENVDDFEKNLYTMRCEERIALAVKRPQALIYADLGFVV